MSLVEIQDDRWIESSDVSTVAVSNSRVAVTLRSGTEVYISGRGYTTATEVARTFVKQVNDANCNDERG